MNGRVASGADTKTVVGWTLVLLLPPVVYLAALSRDFSVQASIFAALLAGTILLWVFSLVEEFVGPLVALVGTLFVGLAPPEVALGGFSSPSMLLLVGVFALSATISSSGLSYRLILRLLLRLPDKPFWHQTALLMSGYGLSPLIPSSNVRLALLTPAYKDMVAGLKLPLRGPAITALLAAMFGGAGLFSPMMVTSKSSNIAAVNFLPSQTQAEFNGLFWLVAAAVAALAVTVAHMLLIPRLFPPEEESALPRAELRGKLAAMGGLRPAEWTAAGCFLFFLIGSATVGWHHIRPSYLAGYVLVALLVTGTLLRKDFRAALDWPQVFFLLGLDGMVRVMDYLGLQEALARVMEHNFDFVRGNIAVFIAVSLVVTLTLRLALPVTAGALTSSVILLPIALAQGINPWICIFCAALFSDISFFRYQGTNGIMQLYSEGLIQEADEKGFRRYNMVMNVARVAAAYASIPWWNQLGLI
ncbi:MAG: anion permease [Mycobacterium sp.]|jgi:hypothetical protein|nr:anion permease [Mycobacterium sp.]